MSTTEQPKYYRFAFRGVKIDPYRIMQVYGITHPAHQHAVKKLLRAGNSVKPLIQDIDEVILSLNRWKEMLNEESINKEKAIDRAIAGGIDDYYSEKARKEKIQSNGGGRRRFRVRSKVEKPSVSTANPS